MLKELTISRQKLWNCKFLDLIIIWMFIAVISFKIGLFCLFEIMDCLMIVRVIYTEILPTFQSNRPIFQVPATPLHFIISLFFSLTYLKCVKHLFLHFERLILCNNSIASFAKFNFSTYYVLISVCINDFMN